LRVGDWFVVPRALQLTDPAEAGSHVPYRVDDVAGSGLALGADHRRSLGDAPQRLAKVATPAYEGHRELPLVDVVLLVRGREHLALVDVVDLERLEHLRLDEVPDPGLRHDGDRHRLLDLADLVGIGHASDAALGADVGGGALERPAPRPAPLLRA